MADGAAAGARQLRREGSADALALRDRRRRATAERKRYASDVGRELGRRLDTGTVGNAATAAALGDFFQYAIDHPVSLARQKSAMLPIVGKDVEGHKVSHLQPGRPGQAPAARASSSRTPPART